MNVVVVIPTYNEVGTIKKVIDSLAKEFESMPEHNFSVLVVDGNSPDGTGDAVIEKSEEYPFVHLLLEEEKRGLGAAYVYGFKHAMENYDADVIVEMDGDLQHNPADVPRLVRAIDEGADYVIGSRFIKGGSIPEEWEFHRKFVSWGGNLFSKVVLGMFHVNDFTSGFKASRVKGFVDRMDLDSVLSKGFAYKTDLLHRMHMLGAEIKEVPIEFGLRNRGSSKMERNNFFDSLKVVLLLRYQKSKSFFRFIVVGFAGLGTDTLLFNLFRLIISSAFASLASGFIAMGVTFTLNNIWSFDDRDLGSKKDHVKSAVIYYVSSYMPILFRSWLIDYSVSTFGNTLIVNNIAFFIGVFVGLIWNFTVYSRFIWKESDV